MEISSKIQNIPQFVHFIQNELRMVSVKKTKISLPGVGNHQILCLFAKIAAKILQRKWLLDSGYTEGY